MSETKKPTKRAIRRQKEDELYNRDYLIGEQICPDCGAFLWERESEVDEALIEVRRECSFCGYDEVSYDG